LAARRPLARASPRGEAGRRPRGLRGNQEDEPRDDETGEGLGREERRHAAAVRVHDPRGREIHDRGADLICQNARARRRAELVFGEPHRRDPRRRAERDALRGRTDRLAREEHQERPRGAARPPEERADGVGDRRFS